MNFKRLTFESGEERHAGHLSAADRTATISIDSLPHHEFGLRVYPGRGLGEPETPVGDFVVRVGAGGINGDTRLDSLDGAPNTETGVTVTAIPDGAVQVELELRPSDDHPGVELRWQIHY